MYCLRDAAKVVTFLAVSFVLAGCGPERSVQWSANGSRIAFVSEGKLHCGDEAGSLSHILAESVDRFEWFPDSQRIVMVQKKEIDNWRDLAGISPIGFDEKKIVAAAEAVREELLGFNGNFDNFKPANSASLTAEQWLVAVFYLKQQDDPRLRQKLGEEWKKLEDLKVEIQTVRVISIPGSFVQSETLLLNLLAEVRDVRLAPDGKAVALVIRNAAGWAEVDGQSLLVCSTETAAQPLVLADQVSIFPDWSPNSRALYYVRCETPSSDSIHMGALVRRTVRGETGQILEKPSDGKDLVSAVSRGAFRVRCLLDGRILLSAIDVSMPAAIEDLPNRSTLFVLNPSPRLSLHRVLPPASDAALPDRADLFELSPDQKLVAVPGSKGRITVVTLSTGETTALIDKDAAEDLRTVPVWRNSQELCLLAAPGITSSTSRRDEIILWSAGGRRAISRSWSDAVMAGVGK